MTDRFQALPNCGKLVPVGHILVGPLVLPPLPEDPSALTLPHRLLIRHFWLLSDVFTGLPDSEERQVHQHGLNEDPQVKRQLPPQPASIASTSRPPQHRVTLRWRWTIARHANAHQTSHTPITQGFRGMAIKMSPSAASIPNANSGMATTSSHRFEQENTIEFVDCEAAPKLPSLPAKFSQDNHPLKCWCHNNGLISSTSGPSSITKTMSDAWPCGWLTGPTLARFYCQLGEQQGVHSRYFEVGFPIWDYTLLINHPSSLL